MGKNYKGSITIMEYPYLWPQKTDVDKHIYGKVYRYYAHYNSNTSHYCENWAKTTKRANELEYIIRKCDPLAAALPTLIQGTAVSSLYSHIAHLNDKKETDIPQPFTGARPKQTKPRGRGKGKQPQQKPNPPPVQVQEQHTYEDTNNYYHYENYRGQSRGCRPYRGQHTG